MPFCFRVRNLHPLLLCRGMAGGGGRPEAVLGWGPSVSHPLGLEWDRFSAKQPVKLAYSWPTWSGGRKNTDCVPPATTLPAQELRSRQSRRSRGAGGLVPITRGRPIGAGSSITRRRAATQQCAMPRRDRTGCASGARACRVRGNHQGHETATAEARSLGFSAPTRDPRRNLLGRRPAGNRHPLASGLNAERLSASLASALRGWQAAYPFGKRFSQEDFMRPRCLSLFIATSLTLLLAFAESGTLRAQAPAPALSGQVSSAEEGGWKACWSAPRRTAPTSPSPSSVTRTAAIASRRRLEVGPYVISIRAVGYDVVGKPRPMSAQARPRLSISSCARLGARIAAFQRRMDHQRARHPAAEAHLLQLRQLPHDRARVQVPARLGRLRRCAQAHGGLCQPVDPAASAAARRSACWKSAAMPASEPSASAPTISPRSILTRVTWEFPLKTLPRPTGRSTRVIITEWDLPRATIEPHDVIVDKDGVAWYSNFGEQTFGKLDPKTGKHTECPWPSSRRAGRPACSACAPTGTATCGWA